MSEGINNVKLGNDYQAKATLESVIENHDEEDVINNAKQKLESIIKKEFDRIDIEQLDATIEIGDTLDYEINYKDLEIGE